MHIPSYKSERQLHFSSSNQSSPVKSMLGDEQAMIKLDREKYLRTNKKQGLKTGNSWVWFLPVASLRELLLQSWHIPKGK